MRISDWSSDVCSSDLRRTWKELIPGSEKVLGTLHVVDGHLVLADLVDCYSRLRVFDVQGHLKGEIKMPGHGSMSAINFVVPNMIDMFAKGGGSGVIFPFSTAAQSPALYKADIHTPKVEALTQPDRKSTRMNSSHYSATRR